MPASYFEKLWRDQNRQAKDSPCSRPDPDELRSVEAREIERIKRLTASMLPVAEGVDDRAKLITVVPFPDFPSPKTSEQAENPPWPLRLTEYGSVLGMIALAVAAFFVLRSLRRRAPREEETPTAAGTDRQRAEGAATEVGPRDDPAGIELDGQLARRLLEKHRAATDEPASAPFGLLRKTDSRRIARILADELPQTIALVLSHLDPRQAGRVLVCFPAEVQVDVIRRLVDLEQTDPEVLHEIEQSLASRLAEQVPMHERRVAGLEAVGGILEASRQPIGRRILDNLAAHDQRLAAEFESYVEQETDTLSLEDLAQLDTAARADLCKAAGDELLSLALVGATGDITERLLAGLPPARAGAIRRSLARPQPTRLSDVDAACDQLIELARFLADAGAESLPDAARPAALSLMH